MVMHRILLQAASAYYHVGRMVGMVIVRQNDNDTASIVRSRFQANTQTRPIQKLHIFQTKH